MSGPWTIHTDVPRRKRQALPKLDPLVLRIMDNDTNLLEMMDMLSKSSVLVAKAFDILWLCRYPRPLECIFDAGTEFTGFEFQDMLQ
jgi:hypothetical protein